MTIEPFEFAGSPWIETEQLAQSLAKNVPELETVAERLIDLCDIATASGASA